MLSALKLSPTCPTLRHAGTAPPTSTSRWGRPHHRNGDEAWHGFFCLLAGVLEIGWAIGLKYTDGFTRIGPTVATVAAMVVSLLLLGLAVRYAALSARHMPSGRALALSVQRCSVSSCSARSPSPTRLLFIAMIVAGAIGLKLVTP